LQHETDAFRVSYGLALVVWERKDYSEAIKQFENHFKFAPINLPECPQVTNLLVALHRK
jgi:hypothetical protein